MVNQLAACITESVEIRHADDESAQCFDSDEIIKLASKLLIEYTQSPTRQCSSAGRAADS